MAQSCQRQVAAHSSQKNNGLWHHRAFQPVMSVTRDNLHLQLLGTGLLGRTGPMASAVAEQLTNDSKSQSVTEGK